MKKIIFQIAVLAFMVQLAACSEESMSEKDKAQNTLTAHVWGNPSVTHASDGNLSADYEGFTLAFTSNDSGDGYQGAYVVANGGHAFADASGKWKFSDDLTKIVLDSGREMQVELSDAHLNLEFFVPESEGRSNGLSGQFTFHLQPL